MVYDELPSSSAGLLRQARHEAGLTQAEMAERAGVPRSMISAYVRQPTMATLLRLLKAAGFELRMHLAPTTTTTTSSPSNGTPGRPPTRNGGKAHHRARIEAGQATLQAEKRKLVAGRRR